MPKNKKPLSDEESTSDSGPDDPNPPKKAKPSTSEKSKVSKTNKNGETKIQLDKNKYVTVREFRGKVYVDVREYYTTNDGDEKPTKKGISMTVQQWSKLKSMIEEIDAAVSEF